MRKYILHFYGPNPQENKDFGRIINVQHTERLAELIDREKVVIGGEYYIANRYVAPTVLDHVDWNSPVMASEIFGPVLPVLEFESLETMIQEINSRPKPLSLYLFTTNKTTEKKIIDKYLLRQRLYQ